VASVGTWAIVGALVGVRLLLILRSIADDVARPADLWSMSVVTSAGDFYSGFIGALVTSAIFFQRHPGMPFWRVADLSASVIALGQAIGRIGLLHRGRRLRAADERRLGRHIHRS